jgi:hypothetical protein
MKRELQISKEEARRAWEELGRREQEERERTASLREGQPTLVGGVQVVPMMQGVPSRHGSARDRPPTRDGPYTSGTPGAVQQVEGPADSDLAYQEYTRSQREPVDPFVESQPRTPTGTRSSNVSITAPCVHQLPRVLASSSRPTCVYVRLLPAAPRNLTPPNSTRPGIWCFGPL